MPPKILAHASTDNFDDDDEFADEFADAFVDEEMEASLAKLEESFQSQHVQHKHQQQHQHQHQHKGRSSSSAYNHDHETTSTSKTSNGNVSIHARASRRGFVDDDLDDVDDEAWGRMEVDKVGNESLENGQVAQHGISTRASSKAIRRDSDLERSRRNASRAPKRARLQSAEEDVTTEMTRRNMESNVIADEIAADRRRIEALERQLTEKENEILRYKKENQMRVGEASVLRANMNKTVADFSSVLREKEEAIAKQRALNAEMKKMHEEQMARSETINAFKHTELATTAHWSSISASAARRRGTTGVPSSQRGYSQSQTAAAAAGLTTPTKRNRGAPRNLGSGEGTSDRSGGRATRTGDRAGDESPSSRRSVLKQRQQQIIPSVSKTKPKTPAFPGFVNSFSKKPLQPQSAKKVDQKATTVPALSIVADDDDVVFQDDQSSPLIERTDQAIGPGSSLVAPASVLKDEPLHGWANPEHRHLWAVTTYTKKLSYLSSLVLSHASSPCSTSAATPHTSTSMTTLYRLLNAALPQETSISQREQYILATHTLLNALSQETARDAEDRFTYLLDPFGYEEEADLDETSRKKEEDAVFWACCSYMEEGLDEVLNGLSSALCDMLAICIDIGAAERVYDVLIMMKAICIHHPSMLHAILTTTHQKIAEDTQPSSESQSQEEELLDTQHQEEAANIPKEIDISRMLISCVKNICRSESDEKANEQPRWKIDVEAAEKILQAVLQIMALMAYEEPQSNVCMHKLRKIVDSQNLLASLMDHSRRSSTTIRKTLQVCTRLAQQSSLWRNIVACKVDKPVEPMRRGVPQGFKTDTPLLEILARLLTDGRAVMDLNDIHSIHCDVITLLSQLVIHQQEALILISESNSILAAVIKCMQIDTGLIWNDEGENLQSHEELKYTDIVERICMDVRFLCQLYITPQRPTSLTKKLQSHECHMILNGMKHYFILAISRIAFAPEPEYFDDYTASMLASVNENALDLLEMILSPEEMDSAWEMLNDDEEEEGEDGGGVGGEDRLISPEGGKGKANEVGADSQTQMDEDVIDLT